MANNNHHNNNSSTAAGNTIVVKAPSSKLINLIAEANFTIESAKEKILAAYKYAIEVDKYSPQQAHDLLKSRLLFSKRYIREVLPLEAKQMAHATRTKEEFEEPVPQTEGEGGIEGLEELRQQKGKVIVEPSKEEEEELPFPEVIQEQDRQRELRKGQDNDIELPDDRDDIQQQQQDSHHAYEIQRHQEVIKHLSERIDYLSKKFEVSVSIDFQDKILPIILIINPDNKTVRWRPDEDEIKRLQEEEHKKLV